MKEIVVRLNQYFLFGILLVIVLFYGKVVLVPIVFAAFLAMLMAPICRKLDDRGWPRGLSSFVCIFILLITLLFILGIVAIEIGAFVKEAEAIEEKANETLTHIHNYIEDTFGLTHEKQLSMAKEQLKGASKSAGSFAGKFLGGLTGTIASLLVTLVFTFLFIFNKERYETFFLKIYRNNDTDKVKSVLEKITTVSQKYLTGRVMSICILAVLYSIGLLLIGVKNALLLAGIAALLTVVPYIGSTLGGLFPFFMALVTGDTFQPALMVIVVIVFIQAIDNYFIEPNIVGGEVNLSALASILIILVGGIIWGVSGMILFIPMLGIVKIVCDNIPSLKPIGYVLGDPDGNKPSRIKQWIQTHIFRKRAS